MTYGQNRTVQFDDFDDARAWAKETGVLPELLVAVDVLLIHERSRELGNFLGEVSSNDAQALLRCWAETEPAAQLLENLGRAVILDPSILQKYIPLRHETSAISYVRGQTADLYLLALLLTRKPDGDEQQDWLARLRLWLITHSFHRFLEYRFAKDHHIHLACDALRKALEDLSRVRINTWLTLLLELKHTATTFDGFNAQIRFQAQALIGNRSFLGQKNELKAFYAISKYDPLAETSGNAGSQVWSGSLAPELEKFSHHGPATVALPGLSDSENFSNTTAELIVGDAEKVSEILSYDANAHALPAFQKLAGSSILLGYGEELQFLPWSGFRPHPFEISAIKGWLEEGLKSDDDATALLTALSWIATNTGRSWRRMQEIAIGPFPQEDWTLLPDLSLRRIVPRRKPGWQASCVIEQHWISPLADANVLHLSPLVARTVRQRLKCCPDAQMLGSLWDSHALGSTSESAMRNVLQQIAPRLTPGMLGGILPVRLFEKFNDPVLARLLSSHPKSGLPGNCAYPSWSEEFVSHALQENTLLPSGPYISGPAGPNNGLGSALAPVEELLVAEIRRATNHLKRLRDEGDIIAFHNAFSAYSFVMLIAATGGRPVTDAFESIRLFDFDERFVHVEDKASRGECSGRHIPLPTFVLGFIRRRYLPHLKKLSCAVAVTHPLFAEAIQRVCEGQPDAPLPLFFMLENSRGLTWISISETSITNTGLFKWPLPLNLFRHRLARILRQQGLDSELIDALLGHSTRNAATHRDLSFRVWSEDMVQARDILTKVFTKLGFDRPKTWQEVPDSAALSAPTDNFDFTRDFGREARKTERAKRTRARLNHAKKVVRDFLGQRKPSELSADEVDQLCKSLLFTSAGLPHPQGYICYRYWIRVLERDSERRGQRVRIKRRYLPLSDDPSIFSAYGPGAQMVFSTMEQQLESMKDRLDIVRLPLARKAALAALSLCLKVRISDFGLITDVLHGQNFRLVTLNKTPYLEYAEALQHLNACAAVKRFRIDLTTARLLNSLCAKTASRHLEEIDATPEIRGIAEILARDFRVERDAAPLQIFKSLCECVNQLNAMKLPGVLNAYLGGRLSSYSLPWRDWMRLENGFAPDFPKEWNTEPDTDENLYAKRSISVPSNSNRLDTVETAELQKNARIFLRNLRGVLDNPAANSRRSNRRRIVATKIAAVIVDHQNRISSALRLLGHWIQSIAYSNKRKQRLKLSAVLRYLDTLAPGFKALAADTEIVSLTSEMVTELYWLIIEHAKTNKPSYVAARLKEFHRWAHREYAVEDPDWNEISNVPDTANSASGILTEAEYQRSLKELLVMPRLNQHQRLLAAALLFCCYRFGLRRSEGWGLRRSDWFEYAEDMIVLRIRDNASRTIKTSAGHRVVPLIFKLTVIENEILLKWKSEIEAQFGGSEFSYMFGVGETGKSPISIDILSKAINKVLKRITGNPDATLHDARHTVANRIALQMANANLGRWEILNEERTLNIESILLNHSGSSRRMDWCLSGYLGHSSSSVSFGSYVHFLGEWANSYAEIDQSTVDTDDLSNAINLDKCKRLKRADIKSIEPSPTAKPNVSQILKVMHLVARGKWVNDAGEALGLTTLTIDLLEKIVKEVGGKVYLGTTKKRLADKKQVADSKPDKEPEMKDDTHPYAFLLRIREPAWLRLLAFANKIDDEDRSAVKFVTDSYQMSWHQSMSVSLKEFCAILSPRWHLVLWEPSHLFFAAAILQSLTEDATRHRLFYSLSDSNDPLFDVAKQLDLELENTKTASGKGKPDRLGIARFGRALISDRIVLVFKESNDRAIRNAMEFYIMVIALWLSNQPVHNT